MDADFTVVISVPVGKAIEAQIKERLRKEKLDRTERLVIINSTRFE